MSTLSEQLTEQFYRWEQRGRGWQVWDYPVMLEPPFVPFFYQLPRWANHPTAIDDGRKPTLLSGLVDRFRHGMAEPRQDDSPPNDEIFDLPANPLRESPLVRGLTLAVPHDGRATAEQVDQFLLALSFCHFPVSFEIIGTSQRITVQYACAESDLASVEGALRAYFPGVVIERADGDLDHTKASESVVVDFGLSEEFMRPLRVFQHFDPDPLTGIVAGLENLSKGETGLLQVMFQATREPWSENVFRSVTDGCGGPFFDDASDMLPLAREKTSRPFFACCIRAMASSSTENRAWDIARRIASGLLPVTASPPSNELIPLTNDDYDEAIHIEDVLKRRSRRTGMLLNSRELASLVHPASGSIVSSKLQRSMKRTRAASESASGEYILGENVHQGDRTRVGLNTRQRLNHLHIIGATGTGKSTLLLNLITQDMEKGIGCAVVDPHGDLIEKVMACVPGSRIGDVVLLDPSDADNAYGINILTATSEAEKNVTISDFVSAIRRSSTSWGDQMTTVLSNAVQAFLESARGGTLLDLKKFLLEEEFRSQFLTTVSDSEVIYFWQKQYHLLRGGTVSSILTRLDAFLRTKLIRRVIAPRKEIDFQSLLSKRKILLVKLAQGLVGEENSTLLGNLVVSKLHQAAMARQSQLVEEREPFFLYIDEFHNFITPSLAGVLSGARKYGLGLVLAHQDLRQLWNQDTGVANSVISNPGTRICFRVGDFDAQKLRDGFSHFTSQDLQSLGVGEAIVRFESATDDFNINILLPGALSQEVAKARKERILELTRMVDSSRPVHEPIQMIIEGPIPSVIEEHQSLLAPTREQKVETEQKPRVKQPQESILPASKADDKALSQHRYLQTLIKRMAEERGYRAIIEQPTPDGSGRVDVGLERAGEKVACEIAVTTTDEHEMQNIEKCLAAGYSQVIVVSAEKRRLDKTRALAFQRLDLGSQAKVHFFEPQELFAHLERPIGKSAVKEERIKGYRVKLEYQEVGAVEGQNKRDAVAQVILQSMRRMKGK